MGYCHIVMWDREKCTLRTMMLGWLLGWTIFSSCMCCATSTFWVALEGTERVARQFRQSQSNVV